MNRGSPSSRLDRDVRRLLRRPAPLGLPIPAYAGRSTANIPSTVWTALGGAPLPEETGVLPTLDPSLDPFAGRRSPGPIVVFLVDGLGWFPFDRWTRSARPRGPRWRAWTRPITTVFPTTTTAALTSLSSGTAPATHGLVGYRQFLPRFGVVADLLRMSPAAIPGNDLLVHADFRPDLISGVPTIFRRGRPAVVVSRERFEGSGFTRLLYDAAQYVPYSTAADLAHQLTQLLTRDPPPGLVYAYWDELDTIQHLRGPAEGGLFDLELDHVAGLLEYVARSLPRARARATTVLVTGDHGQVPSGRQEQIRVDRLPEVAREMAHPLAGDRRAGFLAAKPGRREALGAALSRVLPPGSRLLAMEEALASGLFGPPPYHPELAARLGDFLALPPPPFGLADLPPGAPPPTRHLYGAHGGLEAEELVVPLIAAPLSELAPPRVRGSSGQR